MDKGCFHPTKITKKHIFTDGNKRAAYVTTKLLLKKNGYNLSLNKSEGIALILGVTTAADSEDEMIKVATILKKYSFKYY